VTGIGRLTHLSDDLRKVVTDPEFKTRLGNIGSYSRAMSPAEVLAFVQKEQQTWLPVLEKIAGK
jgi:tripartite-type tricarboxylate transporter receptor subunit TctC